MPRGRLIQSAIVLVSLMLTTPAGANIDASTSKEQTMAGEDVERVKIDAPTGDFSMQFEKPAHWIIADVPPEAANPDFSDPFAFAPVCLVVDPTDQQSRPPMFMIAARPAYPDGTVAQWMEAICENQKLKHGPIGKAVFGDSTAIYCLAQMTDNDEARMVVVLMEDGDRLINIVFLTPAGKWDEQEVSRNQFLNSFRLVSPKGGSAPLGLDDEAATKSSSDLALADDASTLDEENKINANLRDRGIGLVPRIAAKDDATRTATLACGSIQSLLDLPYGWHAIDDGRRVLIFDPQNLTQINCALVSREGASDREILEKTLEGLQSESTGFQHRIDEIDGNEVLMIRDVMIDGQKTQQAYMLAAAADARYAIKIRISCTGDMKQVVRSINVGEQIKKTIRR